MSNKNKYYEVRRNITELTEQNKQSIMTASVIIYSIGYLFVGIGGLSFQVQPAIGYVTSSSNTGCPAGSTWVEGNNLHWCDGTEEFSAVDEAGDPISLVDGTSSGPSGSLWIEGSNLNWIDTDDDEYSFDGQLFDMQYYWYDTQSHYDTYDHPEGTGGFDEYFDTSNSGVTFGGSGSYDDRIYWHNSDWDAKPSYLPADGYSWKAEGYVYAQTSGTYDFAVDSDDASDVWIDGQKVAYWYGGHGTEGGWSHSGSINLEQGWHRFRARMEEGGGGDGIGVAWQKPGDSSYSVIPASEYSDVGSTGPSGSLWMETRFLHYVDSSGQERVVSSGQ